MYILSISDERNELEFVFENKYDLGDFIENIIDHINDYTIQIITKMEE